MIEAMTIRELAKTTGLSTHTLRYYESAGLMPDVPRDQRSGHRRYAERHVRWVHFLRHLRLAGLSVAKVREYVRLLETGERGSQARHQLLAEHRAEVQRRIDDLVRHRDLLDRKLARGCVPDTAPDGPAPGSSGE